MSIAWFPASPSGNPRGAAAVGMLADLPVLEQGAVLLMRHWCSAADGRQAVADDFIFALGADRGSAAVAALDHLISLIVDHGRRPFMRHDLSCACIGGDESAFAQMVAAATADDTEDAMAFALTMLPAAYAYEAVQTARGFGLCVLNLARNLRSRAPYPASSQHH